MEKRLVSSSPHIRNITTWGIMLDVIIALIPATGAAVWFFGLRAAALIAITVISSVFFEYIMRKILKKQYNRGFKRCGNGSSSGFEPSPTLPVWMDSRGIFAIVVLAAGESDRICQSCIGGAGNAYCFYGSRMTSWSEP